jgi:hypothetical protein
MGINTGNYKYDKYVGVAVREKLKEKIYQVDQIQARRYSNLKGKHLIIATTGIERHLNACERMEVTPDLSAIREIIDDAIRGLDFFSESRQKRIA